MKKAFIFVFLFCFSAVAFSQTKTIRFVSEEWANATRKDGTGLYWDIFREVYEPVGYVINIQTRSYVGSVNMVKQKTADVAVGPYSGEVDDVIYPKHHFAFDIVQAVYKKDKNIAWNGQTTIQDKLVGWVKGYSFDEYLDVKVNKREYETRTTLLDVFKKGALDFYLDSENDIDELFRNGSLQEDTYERATVLKLKLFIVFKNDAEGQKLADVFDQRMTQLIAAGKMKEIFESYRKSGTIAFTYPF